jgi:hypothetical protein
MMEISHFNRFKVKYAKGIARENTISGSAFLCLMNFFESDVRIKRIK